MAFWDKGEKVETTASGITVVNVRNDAPRFKRQYKAKLDNRCVIEVVCDTFLGRNFRGELTQPNGNHVYFDPKRIADKIIDPLLVPLVERACDEIEALDRAYMKSDPGEFVDERGVKWRRAE
jgi:hypothetical protein